MKKFYVYYTLDPTIPILIGKFIRARTPEEAKTKFTQFMQKTGLITMTEYIQIEVEEV